MTTQGKLKLKIWLMILGVFAFGCLTGSFLNSAYRLQASTASEEKRSRASKSEEAFNRLKTRLDLNEQQAAEVKTIFEQTRNEFRALKAETQPRFDALRQNADARIRAVLTDEQKKQFDAIIAEKDAQRENEKREKK